MPVIEGTTGHPLLSAGAPAAGTDEIQTLTVSATSGQYRLNFEGFQTADLAYNAANTAIDTALEALPSIGTGGVAVTGAGSPFTITFGGNRGRQAVGLITVSPGTTPYAGGTITCVEQTAGVDATGGRPAAGALCIDTTNKKLYVNTGTALAPTWTVAGAQT